MTRLKAIAYGFIGAAGLLACYLGYVTYQQHVAMWAFVTTQRLVTEEMLEKRLTVGKTAPPVPTPEAIPNAPAKR